MSSLWPANQRGGSENVLNGIALGKDHVLLTGKRWDRMYKVVFPDWPELFVEVEDEDEKIPEKEDDIIEIAEAAETEEQTNEYAQDDEKDKDSNDEIMTIDSSPDSENQAVDPIEGANELIEAEETLEQQVNKVVQDGDEAAETEEQTNEDAQDDEKDKGSDGGNADKEDNDKITAEDSSPDSGNQAVDPIEGANELIEAEETLEQQVNEVAEDGGEDPRNMPSDIIVNKFNILKQVDHDESSFT